MTSEESALPTATTTRITVPSCPAFLSKLWLLVEDETTDDYIHWSEEGNSFIVTDQVTFASILLPQFFKHSNMASFIRQLNMYGFRKKAHLEDGALKTERTDIEFQHPHFVKGELGRLELIKRKVSANESKLKTSDMSRILTDVREVKGKQDSISTKLDVMKCENQALWREVVTLRQRHEKQQKIVNRLIHFLISLVQPKVSATKRRQGTQLMIEGLPKTQAPSAPKYARTLPGTATIDEIPIMDQSQESNLDLLTANTSEGGASLSDITGNSIHCQSRVTELLSENDVLPKNTVLFTSDTVPTEANQESIKESASTDFLGDTISPTRDEDMPTLPHEAPVVSEASPQVSFPLTPADSSWIGPEMDPPAEVFGLEAADVLASPSANTPGNEKESAIDEEPGGGQLVVTGNTPVDVDSLSLASTSVGNSSRSMVQRLLSNEEQKQELGEQLGAVQSNLLDFQNLLSLNPSLNLELGGMLTDFQDIFDNQGTITIPDLSTQDTLETEEDGGDRSTTAVSDQPLAGNELVSYKPPSFLSFMDDDEDSLLKSLDEDSLALKQQEDPN